MLDYQKKFAKYDLPHESKSKAEYLYYKLMIFEKLFPFYATTGLLMLMGLIIMVIRGRRNISLFVRILGWILFAGFLFHTFGLGIRWYISGHSPMSNGYESMIFISWVTLLAGFHFQPEICICTFSYSRSCGDDTYGRSSQLYGSGNYKSRSGTEIILAYTACFCHYRKLRIPGTGCHY